MSNAGNRGHGGSTAAQAGAGAGGMAGTAQQLASEAARTAGQAWDTTSRQAQQLASRAGESLGDFRTFVGRYPVAVFLAGVGVGFLLARAFDRWPTDMTRRMSWASER